MIIYFFLDIYLNFDLIEKSYHDIFIYFSSSFKVDNKIVDERYLLMIISVIYIF